MKARALERGALDGVPKDVAGLPAADSPESEVARKAIMQCIDAACHVSLADALAIQAKHSAEFMLSAECRRGMVGSEYTKTMVV